MTRISLTEAALLPLGLLPTPPTLTAHLGRVTVAVRPNRSRLRLGPSPHSRFLGSVGLGLVSASWLYRSAGRTRWGLESTRPTRGGPAVGASG